MKIRLRKCSITINPGKDHRSGYPLLTVQSYESAWNHWSIYWYTSPNLKGRLGMFGHRQDRHEKLRWFWNLRVHNHWYPGTDSSFEARKELEEGLEIATRRNVSLKLELDAMREAYAALIAPNHRPQSWQRDWQIIARQVLNMPDDAPVEDIRLALALRQGVDEQPC